MFEHQGRWPISVLCRVLRVHHSGYYRWLKNHDSKNRDNANRDNANVLLQAQIAALFKEYKGRYGSPRLCRELRERGLVVNRKRVARLMRLLGLRAKSAKRFKATTNSRHHYPVAANLLDRRFAVAGANRLWVSDITYVWTGEGWLYLAVVLDAWSRQVVGWAWSVSLAADFAVRALNQALESRRPAAGWMHHSDQGVQYACGAYQQVLRSADALVSMSRKGNCWDNALAESFFGTLKKELIQGEKFKTRRDAVSAIFEYIEVFYNRQRKHSKLGYQSPAEFEVKNQNHPFSTLH